jgi:allantoin racemase
MRAVLRKDRDHLMRVLYQIPGDVSGGPLGRHELERRRGILQEWASAGVAVEVTDAPGGPHSIESHAEEALCVGPMLRALGARAASPDAVIIGCFGDPGLAAVREVMDCPVVGPFESAFHLGAQLGHRIGVVTVLESVVPVIDRLAMTMGVSSAWYAGGSAIDVPVLELAKDASRVAALVAEASRELIRERRADVVVLGCMSLAFLGIGERAASDIGVPVINPARAALKTAEALLSQGLTHSRRAYPKPRKPVHGLDG